MVLCVKMQQKKSKKTFGWLFHSSILLPTALQHFQGKKKNILSQIAFEKLGVWAYLYTCILPAPPVIIVLKKKSQSKQTVTHSCYYHSCSWCFVRVHQFQKLIKSICLHTFSKGIKILWQTRKYFKQATGENILLSIQQLWVRKLTTVRGEREKSKLKHSFASWNCNNHLHCNFNSF